MSEPSYYPLTRLHFPRERAASASVGSPGDDSELRDPSDTIMILEGPPVSLSHPVTPTSQGFRNGPSPSRPFAWGMIRTSFKLALLPLAAIAYLAFCYTVHGKAVPVGTYGLYAVTSQNFTTIKGAITSVNIIIISIALYPVYSIISDLQTEEFFRVLGTHGSRGVPLEIINNMSTPSFGNIDKMMAIRNHACSYYYMLGIVASLLVWIVATLAPGALTITSVLADGGLAAFEIGAVPPQSVLNGTQPASPIETASFNSGTAASIAWAEIELGVQYSFGVANTSEPEYATYMVPMPLNLSTTTNARWLSDIIGINPICSWASTNLTNVQIPLNSSTVETLIDPYLAVAYLPDFNLDIQLNPSDISILEPVSVSIIDFNFYVLNHTTQAIASDGSTVFLLVQCTAGCSLLSSNINISIDMSSLSNAFTITLTDSTWSMALLACIPNITIETREVRNDGLGILSVQPLPSGRSLTRQGNLDPVQTTAMFSAITMGISQSQLTSTDSGLPPLGSQVQAGILFGQAQVEGIPGVTAPYNTSVTLSPASIEDITVGYTQLIQSASKSYLAGYLGTAYVPGRISSSEIIFAASMPNLIVATVVFALLIVLIFGTHFRPGKGVEFSLVNIVAAVHGSELPALFAQGGGAHEHADRDAQGEEQALGGEEVDYIVNHTPDDHRDIMEAFRGKRIFMQKRADGSAVLHISS